MLVLLIVSNFSLNFNFKRTCILNHKSVLNISAVTYGKECQPDCKASRNERCQRIDSIMKCVCRPGFARMFPDRPCKRESFCIFRQLPIEIGMRTETPIIMDLHIF